MKRLGVRVPADMWEGIQWYAKAAGLLSPGGSLDISEAVRDLVSRGLVQERGAEAGYRSGYREGKLAAWRDHMQRIAAATRVAPPAPTLGAPMRKRK
jgi:hypothetical protein